MTRTQVTAAGHFSWWNVIHGVKMLNPTIAVMVAIVTLGFMSFSFLWMFGIGFNADYNSNRARTFLRIMWGSLGIWIFMVTILILTYL